MYRRERGDTTSTAEAVSHSRVVRIPADYLVRCIHEAPAIALAIIGSTSQRLHRLVQEIEHLKAQSGIQRVAAFLASLCPPGAGPHTITLPYDKTLIAGRLGLKPESLSRAFAKLRRVGVDVRASHVVVRDVGKLRYLATNERVKISSALAGRPVMAPRASAEAAVPAAPVREIKAAASAPFTPRLVVSRPSMVKK